MLQLLKCTPIISNQNKIIWINFHINNIIKCLFWKSFLLENQSYCTYTADQCFLVMYFPNVKCRSKEISKFILPVMYKKTDFKTYTFSESLWICLLRSRISCCNCATLLFNLLTSSSLIFSYQWSNITKYDTNKFQALAMVKEILILKNTSFKHLASFSCIVTRSVRSFSMTWSLVVIWWSQYIINHINPI